MQRKSGAESGAAQRSSPSPRPLGRTTSSALAVTCGGDVRRRSWTELPAVPDTVGSVRQGVYRVIGDQMYIVLPFEDEGEQWLRGTITDEGLYIDQLEPEQGACK